jgi:hypothetical protein
MPEEAEQGFIKDSEHFPVLVEGEGAVMVDLL